MVNAAYLHSSSRRVSC